MNSREGLRLVASGAISVCQSIGTLTLQLECKLKKCIELCKVISSIGDTTCDSLTGQCECKGEGSGVSSLRCDSCLPEYWNFNPTTGT